MLYLQKPLAWGIALFCKKPLFPPVQVTVMFHRMARLWQKLKPLVVAEVPADSAACEFDCRELDCSSEDWQNCPQRIQKAAAIKSLEHKDTVQ
ncbi:MAG: hypothetical protein ACFCVD_17385 [Nodosilinea sp.]